MNDQPPIQTNYKTLQCWLVVALHEKPIFLFQLSYVFFSSVSFPFSLSLFLLTLLFILSHFSHFFSLFFLFTYSISFPPFQYFHLYFLSFFPLSLSVFFHFFFFVTHSYPSRPFHFRFLSSPDNTFILIKCIHTKHWVLHFTWKPLACNVFGPRWGYL